MHERVYHVPFCCVNKIRVISFRSHQKQCEAADTLGRYKGFRHSPRRFWWWLRISHLMFRGVSPSPCSHIYSGRGPRGISQQAAWRSRSVDSSRARSHLEPAFSLPSSGVAARTFRQGISSLEACEPRIRGAVAASYRHSTSTRMLAMGTLGLRAGRARWALSSSTCSH